VLPRVHEDINEEWISDKTRHACDGLRMQRLDRPYIRVKGKLQEASWQEAFDVIAKEMHGMQPSQMAALAGNLACGESIMALRDVLDSVGVANRDCRQEGAKLNPSSRSDYIFNTTIAGIERADVCVLIGANPRREAAMVNARLRKAYLKRGLQTYHLGAPAEFTFPCEYLGNNPRLLEDIVSGKHPLAKILANAKNPMLIIGASALARLDGENMFAAAKAIAEKYGVVKEGWNGFNVLHHAASRVGALDLGFVPAEGGRDIGAIFEGCQSGEIKLVYLLGADEFDMALLGKAFVIYQGHHGDDGAHRADVVLPGAAYTEKDATYVNTEGRVQRTKRAVFPPGQAKDDWEIIAAVAQVLKKPLSYQSLGALRKRMESVAPHFAQVGTIVPAPWMPAVSKNFSIDKAKLEEFITNFYMTDPISRASKTMAECTRDILGVKKKEAA
jgi:NADH-quinone oxidoreductase subunit G